MRDPTPTIVCRPIVGDAAISVTRPGADRSRSRPVGGPATRSPDLDRRSVSRSC